MAAGNRRIPTFHVVPRFDISAKGGPLELGTVVSDLHSLRPLNRRAGHVPIPTRIEPYTPVPQTGFRETRTALVKGNFVAWAKALGQWLGGSAKVSGKKDEEETVVCEAVVTVYFDPDHGYVAQSLAAKSVHEYFIGSGLTKDVFLVTGLKVAKKLIYKGKTVKEAKVEGKVEAKPPEVPVEAGVSGNLENNSSHMLDFEADDIVVGFRVRRYRYVQASILPWENRKKLQEEEFLEGAELLDGEEEVEQQPQFDFEEVPIEEEIQAQERAGNSSECWVTA